MCSDTLYSGSIQLIHAELDWNRGDIDDTGLLLRGGIRYAIQQNLHLEGDLSYITNDFWDDDELGVKVGLRFYPASQLSLAVGAANDQELDGLYVSNKGAGYIKRKMYPAPLFLYCFYSFIANCLGVLSR